MVRIKPWAGWVLSLVIVLLTGCGGGSSTEENPAPEPNPEPEPLPLSLSASEIPDNNLRDCLNSLAEAENWSYPTDVDAIRCENMEIRSIQGLQQFPNLTELKISAPRFDIDELPILTSLPLADYERLPYYINGESDNPESVKPSIKQILLYERLPVASTETVTLLFLTVNDASQQSDAITWNIEDQDATGGLIEDRGQLIVNDNVSLHWLRLNNLDGARDFHHIPGTDFMIPMSLGERDFHSSRSTLIPNIIAADVNIGDLSSNALTDCVTSAAQTNGWTRTWQVTSLDCRGYDVTANSALKNFPQLRWLALNGVNDLSLSALYSLPYLETLVAPDATLEPHDISLYDFEIEPEPQPALSRPQISIQPCGLQIDNFDASVQYHLSPIHNNDVVLLLYLLASPPNPIDWSGGEQPDCMPLSGEFAWGLSATKDSETVLANAIPVTNNEGQFIQVIYDNARSDPSMTVPGVPQQQYYVVRKYKSHYHIEQYDLESWQLLNELETLRLPLISTQEGVFLVTDPGDRLADPKQVWLLPHEGQIRPLPDLPIAATPTNAIEFNGEVWFYDLQDAWGSRPELLVWNPTQQSWRTVSVRDPDFSLILLDNHLCAEFSVEDRECLQSDGVTWLPIMDNTPVLSGTVQTDLIPSTAYYLKQAGYDSLFPGIDIDLMPRLAVPAKFEVSRIITYLTFSFDQVEDLEDIEVIINRPATLLDLRVVDQPEYIGPVLPSLPWRSNYRFTDDMLYVLYNDSIARYPLPLKP